MICKYCPMFFLITCVLLVGCLPNLKGTQVITEMESSQISFGDVEEDFSTKSLYTRTADVTLPSITTTPEKTDTIANTPLVTNTKLPQEGCTIMPVKDSTTVLNVDWALPLLSTSYKVSESFTINLITGEKIPLPYLPIFSENEVFLHSGTVSPDGKWLAYVTEGDLDVESQLLTIMNNNGEILKTILLSKEIRPLQIVKVEQWLDNNHLVLVWPGYKTDHGETNPQGLTPIGSTTVVLNPFTEEWVEYGTDYPDVFTRFPEFTNLWNTSNYSLQVYNNSFDRVLYLSTEGLVLWDVAQRQQIMRIVDDPTNSKSKPIWSAEGDKFLVDLKTSQGYNLFVISKDGVESQVTHLQGYKAGDFTNYSWSPDEKFVAFWLHVQSDYSTPYEYYYLNIVDLLTQEIKTFCVIAPNWHNRYPRYYPLWSPDGKYIVINAANESDLSRSMTLLLDISDERAYKIVEDMIPLGWMKNE